MIKSIAIGFISLSIIFSCSNPSSPKTEKRVQLIVEGNIDKDMTWEKRNDIVIKGIVKVDSGVNLIIEPDVHITIEGQGSFIQIYGSISANGKDTTTSILFKASEEHNTNKWQKCLSALDRSKLNLAFCKFDGFLIAISNEYGNLIVENSTFINCNRGIYNVQTDTCKIQQCIFTDNEFDITFERAMVTDINKNLVLNCVFQRSKEIGVKATNKAYVSIINNQFIYCKMGIFCEFATTAMIQNNTFHNCETGIRFYLCSGYGKIYKNEIYQSAYGIILANANPPINYNNLLTCNFFKIQSIRNVEGNVNAKNNWWGTYNEDEIRLSIQDANDDDAQSDAGLIEYLPIMNGRIEDAGILR
jgi:hypothetical protein